MNNVTLSEFNTDDEKLRVVNRIIDNQNMIEGKLLQLIAKERSVDAYNKKVDK
ncbi:hypothetical protein LCGC14_2679010, partial [marine sediment metagenome]